jgi:hypothetical protein
MSKVSCCGREILEDVFDGDLEAYAEDAAKPKPPGVENDPDHPWHDRIRLAKLTIDQPDDCILPREYDMLYTRAEICEWLGKSDSGFGKMQVPHRRKSGRYSLYSMVDVFAYGRAWAWVRGYRDAAGKPPPENIHQIAAMRTAEIQNEDGPAKFWTPPAETEES